MFLLILVYNMVLGLCLLVLLPAWLIAALVIPRFRRELAARFSLLRRHQAITAGGIWLHAASAGEAVTAVPLIDHLERAGFPCTLFSTSTVRGREMAAKQQRAGMACGVIPPDLLPWMVLLFRRIRPRALLLVNSEFWISLLWAARRDGVPVFVVNGKLSEKSFRRFHRLRLLIAPFFLIPRMYLVRSDVDAERFHALGVPTDRILTVGSLRFAAAIERIRSSRVAELPHGWLSDYRLFLAGSTRAGEEEIVLDAFSRLQGQFPDLRLLIAPREPSRSGEVTRLVLSRGLQADVRSRLEGSNDWKSPVLVWDTFGELAHLYPFARVAFVGGSLVDAGGHNPLESGLWGVPTLFGPSRFNVVEECTCLEAMGLGFLVRNAEDVVGRATQILRDGLAGSGRVESALRMDADPMMRSLNRTVEVIRLELSR